MQRSDILWAIRRSRQRKRQFRQQEWAAFGPSQQHAIQQYAVNSAHLDALNDFLTYDPYAIHRDHGSVTEPWRWNANPTGGSRWRRG